MAIIFDVFVVLFILLGIGAELERGLFLALTDIARIAGALLLGLLAYAIGQRVTHNYVVGFVAFGVVALAVVLAVPSLIKRAHIDPSWGKSKAGRVGGGLVGGVIGFLICATFVPVLSQDQAFGSALRGSVLAARFLDFSPALYGVADAIDLDLPMLNRRPIRFEDEGAAEKATLVKRVNYSRLNGSTCIECGAAVDFVGYRRRMEVSVSPLFTCPNCGRTSDGCQTFEGFHRMYGRCPVVVAADRGPIDCGVWPNDRPVYPKGECPVDGNRY